MSWLFEQAAPVAPAHEAFFELAQAGPRQVSLLEFVAFDVDDAISAGSLAAEASADAEEERQVQERARTLATMIDAAREEAREQTHAGLQVTLAAMEAKQRGRVEHLVGEFARDRQRFFAAAENQVVQLALAIARQVLAREVAQDPMHLAGAVRAALRKVQDEVGTVLRAPLEEAEGWRALLNTPGGTQVQVVASDRLMAGECVLETQVGRIELSVAVQMAEIERGFEQVLPRQGR